MVLKKVKLGLNPNTINWRMTFMKRSAKLKRKMGELATLCDVPALFICFGSNGEVDTWPEEPDGVSDIIHRFQNHQKFASKNQLGQASYLAAMIDKREEQLRRLIKDDFSLPFFTWDQRLNCLPLEVLMELIASLESKKMVVHGRIQSLLQNPNPNPNPSMAMGNQGDEGLSHTNGGLLQSLPQNPNPNSAGLLQYPQQNPNPNLNYGGLLQYLLQNPNPNPNPSMAMGNQADEGLCQTNGGLLQSLLQNPNPNPNMAMGNQADERLSHNYGGPLESVLQKPNPNCMAICDWGDEGLSEGLDYVTDAVLGSLLQNPNPNPNMGRRNHDDAGLGYTNGDLLLSLLQNPNMALGNQADEGLCCANGNLLQFLQRNPDSDANYMPISDRGDEGWSHANGGLMDHVQPLLHGASSQGQNLDDLDHNISLSSCTMQEIIHKDDLNCNNASVDDYFSFIPPLMRFKRLDFDVSGSHILEPSSLYHFGGDL